ncbi:hypothetical protein FRC08_001658, partial [Ceratobasidium sp. 394]
PKPTVEPTPEPALVESTPAVVEELVVLGEVPAVTEEAPIAAEAVPEEVAVGEAPASTEAPLIDSEPAPAPVEPTPDVVEPLIVTGSAPGVVEPTVITPEPESVVAPTSEPEATAAPAPVESTSEAALPETKLEELASVETKDKPPAPEPTADPLASPKAEEKPLPDELKEPTPAPAIIIAAEEPKPKEEPTLPTPTASKKASKKKARKKSLAQPSEPAPAAAVETQPVSPIAAEAQPTSPIVEAQPATPVLAVPEVVEAPNQVVPAVDPTSVVDEPVKSSDEVEGPVDSSFGTPKPTVQALPTVVHHVVEEVPAPIVEPVAEEVKMEELAVKAEVEEPVVVLESEVQKAEESEVEVQKVEESEVRTPKVEPVAIEEPKIEELPAKDPPVEELVVVALEPTVETPVVEESKPEEPKPEALAIEVPAVEAPLADVPSVEPETPATPVVESSKKNKKKKKKEKANAKAEPAIETPVVETPVTEAPVVEAPAVVEPTPQVVEKDEPAPERIVEPITAPVVVHEPVLQPVAPQTLVEPARVVSPISPKEKEKAVVAPSPITPAEGRFSFFSSFVRKARLLPEVVPEIIPEVVPEAPARLEQHSPTPSELALDLDTPVNLTPKFADTKLPEVQPPIEVAAAVAVPSAPPSEPPTPGPRHELLEKKLSMFLEEAEASIEHQEIHPENTTMSDPPPAYSSPKIEPTVNVVTPTSVPELARDPEPTPVTQPVVAEPTTIVQPEIVAQPESVAQPEVPQPANVDQSEITEPTVVAPPAVVPEPTASPQPVAFAQILEASWVRRKTKSSKKSMRDKTPDPPRKAELATPISPVIASVMAPDEPVVASPPVSSKPIPELVKGPSPAPNEAFSPVPQLLSPKSCGSISTTFPSIDETARSPSPGKPRSHAAMPPLISIPVTTTPLHSPVPAKSPLAKERGHILEAETRPQPLPSPPALAIDGPEKAPSPPAGPSQSYEGFSAFRWFGFGPPVTPPVPAEKTPEPVPKSEAAPPTPVSPVKEKGKEKERRKSSKTASVSTNNIVLMRTPTSPSPRVEKIEWSRWPNQPTTPSNEPEAPVVRDSQADPTRTESRTNPGSSGTATPVVSPVVFSPVPPGPPPVTPVSAVPTATTRVTLARTVAPTVSVPTIPAPLIPLIPALAVAPSVPAPRADPHWTVPRDVSAPSTTSAITQEATRPKDTLTREERRQERAKKLAAAMRDASPMSHTPSVSFQSPRSTNESLPVHSPSPARVEPSQANTKPAPRGILKQRSAHPAPTLSIPVIPSTRASSQSSRLEFTGSRDVPIYDNWEHAPRIRQDLLAATSSVRSPREKRAPTTSPISPSTGRSHTTGDSRYRVHPTAAEATSPSSRPASAHVPFPSRESRTTTRSGHTQPEFIPVLNDRTTRAKAARPSRISTVMVQSPTGAYVEPLTSPILLTSENCCTRVPEGTIYQYDVRISPSESLVPTIRKQIFDALQKTVAPQVFTPLARASYDGGKMMYARRKLDVSSRQEVSLSKSHSPTKTLIISMLFTVHDRTPRIYARVPCIYCPSQEDGRNCPSDFPHFLRMKFIYLTPFYDPVPLCFYHVSNLGFVDVPAYHLFSSCCFVLHAFRP